MQRRKFRFAWLGCILLAITLACNFITGLSQDVESARQTAQYAGTQVQAIATQAQGLATSVEESGYLKTAQAIATERGSEILGTAQALATEAEERGVLDTAQAYVTQEGSNLFSTAKAATTKGIHEGEAPEDIPIVDQSTIQDFYGSQTFITYLTSLDFQSVLNFYKTEMPARGWASVAEGSFEASKSAHLNFSKPTQTASVTLNVNPIDQKTIVVILLQNQ
ncbi:MAG TPA: hypothetical protein VE136_10870 [Anaerolineales bacterium]|jgi:hypothetical protein|nr:hypothetical protein [Anaerolineales bacterium]